MAERLRQGERVGSGAMADVYRGVLGGERGVQKVVAIKRLREDLRSDPRAVELFVNEASIAVRLAHPNVVQGLEFARDDDGYYLVCEWLDCVTLSNLRDRCGPLAWPLVVHIGRALCDALAHVHAISDADGRPLDIVHRDVTPDNVFVTAAGQVKLGDFGVASCRVQAGAIDVREVGTPGFAAPEQAQGAWDVRSDIYGVGATLRALTEDLPPAVEAVLDRACSEEPAARFTSARELGRALVAAATESDGQRAASEEDLRSLVEELGTQPCAVSPKLDGAVQSILGGALAGPTETPISATPPPRRVRPLLVAGVGGFALLALVLLLWATRASQADDSALAVNDVVTGPGAPEPGAASPTPPPAPPLPPEPVPAAAEEPPPKPAPVPTVTININSVPWARVAIDGRAVGNTPLRRVEVPIGKRQVVLVHPPDDARGSFTIQVDNHPGQSFIFNLRRGSVDRRTLPP